MTGSKQSSAFDSQPAARRFVEARRTGKLIDDLAEGERPSSLAQAYAIQKEVARLSGEPVAGFKLGGANPRALRESASGKPTHGFMPKPRVHANGAKVAAPKSGKIIFELEICMELGDTIPAGASPAAKLAAMKAAYLGIELVSSRFVDRTRVGPLNVVADDIGFHGYILGPQIARAQWPAAFAAHAEIAHGGKVIAANLSDDTRTDAVEALSLFIDDAAATDVRLESGMLVTTGSIVAPRETGETGVYVGSLGDLRVSCEILPAS